MIWNVGPGFSGYNESLWQEMRPEIIRRVRDQRHYLLHLLRQEEPALPSLESLEQLMKSSPHSLLELALEEQQREALCDERIRDVSFLCSRNDGFVSSQLESEIRWRIACIRTEGVIESLSEAPPETGCSEIGT